MHSNVNTEMFLDDCHISHYIVDIILFLYHLLGKTFSSFHPSTINKSYILIQFPGCSVYGNSDSDIKPLTTDEDISLNSLDGLGSLISLNNLVPSSLEASQEFLPLALFYKNNAENLPASQTDKAYQPPPSYPPSSTTSAPEAENIRKSIFIFIFLNFS